MSRTKRTQSEALFTTDPNSGETVNWNHTEIAPSVSVEEHRDGMLAALRGLGVVSQKRGLERYASTPEGVVDLVDRYQDETSNVLEGAAKNREAAYNDAREAFLSGLGSTALVKGLEPKNLIETEPEWHWAGFMDKHGGPTRTAHEGTDLEEVKGRAVRDAYITKLQNAQKVTADLHRQDAA